VSSPSNEELLWTADELSSALEAINQDLDDLQESIAAVQAHPEAFNLSGSEVQSRNNFITRTRNTVREIEDTIRNPPRKASPRNNQVGNFF
jgi:prefoldin subunit 5